MTQPGGAHKVPRRRPQGPPERQQGCEEAACRACPPRARECTATAAGWIAPLMEYVPQWGWGHVFGSTRIIIIITLLASSLMVSRTKVSTDS